VRPSLFVFTSIGRLGHDRNDPGGLKSGLEGRITVSYRFTRPGHNLTLFSRTMTIEAYKHAPLPDQLFEQANPAKIDAYHEAVASRGRRARTRSIVRLTPVPAVRDTFAMFCKGLSG
jgi:hypothetical protein